MEAMLITALWCPSCLIMRPRYMKIIRELDVKVQEVDYDEDTPLYEKYNIGVTLPVLIIFKDKKEIKRIVGEKTSKELEKIFGGIMNEK